MHNPLNPFLSSLQILMHACSVLCPTTPWKISWTEITMNRTNQTSSGPWITTLKRRVLILFLAFIILKKLRQRKSRSRLSCRTSIMRQTSLIFTRYQLAYTQAQSMKLTSRTHYQNRRRSLSAVLPTPATHFNPSTPRPCHDDNSAPSKQIEPICWRQRWKRRAPTGHIATTYVFATQKIARECSAHHRTCWIIHTAITRASCRWPSTR